MNHLPSILTGITTLGASIEIVRRYIYKPLSRWGHRQDNALSRIEQRLENIEIDLAEVRGKVGLPVERRKMRGL